MQSIPEVDENEDWEEDPEGAAWWQATVDEERWNAAALDADEAELERGGDDLASEGGQYDSPAASQSSDDPESGYDPNDSPHRALVRSVERSQPMSLHALNRPRRRPPPMPAEEARPARVDASVAQATAKMLCTQLIAAVRSNASDRKVEHLLQEGATVWGARFAATGGLGVALRFAVRRGSVRLTGLLLRYGAAGDDGAALATSPPMLWHAVRGRHVRVARLLINARASVHLAEHHRVDGLLQREAYAAACAPQVDDGWEIFAAADGDAPMNELPDGGLTRPDDFASMLRLLLEAGADPNALEDDHEMTPLWHAVALGRLDRVQLLLRHGADPQLVRDVPQRILHRYSDTLWSLPASVWADGWPNFTCVLRAALMRIPREPSADVLKLHERYAVVRQLVAADASRGDVDADGVSDAERQVAEFVRRSEEAWAWRTQQRSATLLLFTGPIPSPEVARGPRDAAVLRRRRAAAKHVPVDLQLHRSCLAFLQRSRGWSTRLHFLEELTAPDVVNLVRGGADVHAAGRPGYEGAPTPVQRAVAICTAPPSTCGREAAQALLVLAGWSVPRHRLFPERERTRAVLLKRLSASIARQKVDGAAESFAHAFDAFVLPRVLRAELEARIPKESMAVAPRR